MKKQRVYKVFVEQGNEQHYNWIDGVQFVPSSFEQCDIFVLTGGSDIQPHYYGESYGQMTYCSPQRDAKEKLLIDTAIKMGKFIIGICRGAQFMCVCSGGKMIQHVTNHSGKHPVYDVELYKTKKRVKLYDTNSVHHQMMNPYNLDPDKYEMLFASTPKLRKDINPKYLGENNHAYQINGVDIKTIDFVEPEVIYFKETNAFCIQGHPEWMGGAEYKRFLQKLSQQIRERLKLVFKNEKKNKVGELV